ncbi:MAG: hypothetical protein C5S48_09810 [Candidatus Methanogaster sp.]|nr:MAG: hypothetical protein C5S48_09810 [ANME-2 cluster archaeon]
MIGRMLCIVDVDKLPALRCMDVPTGNRDSKISTHLQTNREHSQTWILVTCNEHIL